MTAPPTYPQRLVKNAVAETLTLRPQSWGGISFGGNTGTGPSSSRQWTANGVQISAGQAASAMRQWEAGSWARAELQQAIVGLAKEKGTTYAKAAAAVSQAAAIAAGMQGEQDIGTIARDLLSGKSPVDVIAGLLANQQGPGPQTIANQEASQGASAEADTNDGRTGDSLPGKPSGPRQAIRLAFDFSDASLTGKEKHAIMVETREKYKRVGLVVTAEPMDFNKARLARQVGENVFPVKFQDEPAVSKAGKETAGFTDPWNGEWSIVSLARAPEDGRVTWLANVAGHEIGHQLLWNLEDQYLNRHHATAAEGSLMESIPMDNIGILAMAPRFLDAEDARKIAGYWGN